MSEEKETETHENVHKCVAAIMAEITQIPKTQKNKHANYMFASRDDIVGALRPLMAKHGVTFHLGKLEAAHRYEAVYTCMNDPESQIRFAIDGVGCKPGQKQDQTPQNFGSALSYVEKYAHRVMFLIDTGDAGNEEPSGDPDYNDPNGGGKEPEPTPPKPQITPEMAEAKDECSILADELGMDGDERKAEFLKCERDYIVMRDTLRGRVKAAEMLAGQVENDKENAKKAGGVK